ncbi:MAG TPA: hypothetical protein VJR70_11795, partial [Stellaceae bacterium]|nr:hypothetical protein [Stellaceae bacterium]
EDQLARVRKQTVAEQQEIRVLSAEWAYLNQPERLADLNRRFLGLAPIAPGQLQRKIGDIPLRAPEPHPEPDAVIAAAPTPVPAAAPASAAPARPILPVRLATEVQPLPIAAPPTLDALIAQIADAR